MEHSSDVEPTIRGIVERKNSKFSGSQASNEKVFPPDVEINDKATHHEAEPIDDRDDTKPPTFYTKWRPLILGALALVILGWWISATIMHTTRHRW